MCNFWKCVTIFTMFIQLQYQMRFPYT
jgi:hypothetical protein